MDDLKIYRKSEREIISLVSTVELFSTDVGMEEMWCTCSEERKGSRV